MTLNIILLTPGVSLGLASSLVATSLAMITIVIARVAYEEFFSKHLTPFFQKFFKPHLTIVSEEKYGGWVLLAVSLGATIGPSTFVIAPYAVLKYGFMGVIGFILASIVSWLLAWVYSIMYYYSKYKLRQEVVGGPAFIKVAYSEKDPRYLLSRFMMWIGNSALSAFNMLIAVNLLSTYFYEPLTGSKLPYIGQLILLLILSLFILLLYNTWERAVKLQCFITLIFVIAYFTHMLWLAKVFPITFPKFNIPVNGFSGLIFYTLTSAAYVYMVAFGFQEVMGLGENVKGENPEERFRILKKAMIGGATIANIIILLYILELYLLEGGGVVIPETAIPILDMLRDHTMLYWFTFSIIFLGIATTLIPAFVASLKHLEQLTHDFFKVKTTTFLPYFVIFLAWFLFASGAEFLIHLTDFSVLFSLGLIASSSYRLRVKAGSKTGSRIPELTVSTITFLMFLTLAYVSREVAEESVLFMWFSTIAMVMLSYDLLLVELFTIVLGLFTTLFADSILKIILRMAVSGGMGTINIPLYESTIIALWILQVSLIAIMVHVVIKNIEFIKTSTFLLLDWFKKLLKSLNYNFMKRT